MKVFLIAIFFAYFINTLYGKPPPIVSPEDDNDVITRQKRELLIPGIPRAHHSASRTKRSIIHSPEYTQLTQDESGNPEEAEYSYQRPFGPRHPNVLAAAGERKKEEEVGLTPAEELALLIEEELVEQEPPKSIFRERQRLLRNGGRTTRQRLSIPDGNPSYGSIFRERQRTLNGKSGQGLDLPAFKEVKRGEESAFDFVKALFDYYVERNPQLTDEEREGLWEFMKTAVDDAEIDKRTPGRLRVLGSSRGSSGNYNSRYGSRRQGRSVSTNPDIDDVPEALDASNNGGHVSKYFQQEKDNLAMRKRYALNHFKDFAPTKHQNLTPNELHDNNATQAPKPVLTSTGISA